MKILVSGASGMVGKNICENARSEDYVFLTPSSSELDLLNQEEVKSFISKESPDLIIHAAGRVGGIQANIANPVDFLVENLYMGINLLSAAYAHQVPNFLNLSSSCMYPRGAKNPLSENLILKGELEPTNEGYAIAKTASTRLCEYIVQENPALKYKTIIPCNLYGRHDKFDPKKSHMIPSVIKKIHEAKCKNEPEVEIWGDGLAQREFMYAGDLADFIFEAIERINDLPQNINVGLGHDYTINEYYSTVADVVGYDGSFTHDLSKPVGMKQKLIDDTLLKKFGWQYSTSLQEGIRKTFDYYLSLDGINV